MSKITYKRVPDNHRDWVKYAVVIEGETRYFIQKEYYSMASGTFWKAVPAEPGTRRVAQGGTLKECKAKLEEYINENH